MTQGKRGTRDFVPEFRIQAVRLVLDEKVSVAKAAGNLGIPVSTLHGWMKKFRSGFWDINTGEATGKRGDSLATERLRPAVTQHGLISSEKQRIQELERQNRRLTLERDILKKAMAYCVDVPK